jgi:hypothetical protein
VTIVSLSLGSPMRFEIMSVNKRKVCFLSCQWAAFFSCIFLFDSPSPAISQRFIQSGHLHDLVVDNVTLA